MRARLPTWMHRLLPARLTRRGEDAHEAVQVSLERLIALRPQVLQFLLAQRRRSDLPLAGGHRSGVRGRGLDFEELRAYQPGDDIRAIDWQVTARTGRAHTRRYREERERPLLILVDLRRPMRFGTRRRLKSVAAARAAALLAWAGLAAGDRVGGLVFTERHYRVLRPRCGRAGVLPLLAALTDLHRSPTGEPAADAAEAGEFDLALALRRLRRIARPGTLVHVLSDFHDLGPAAEREFAELARHTDLMGSFLYDALEAEPPPPGRYAVTDGATVALLDTTDPAVAQAYAARFAAQQERVTGLFLRHRAHLLRLGTHHNLDESLRLLLRARALGARAAA